MGYCANHPKDSSRSTTRCDDSAWFAAQAGCLHRPTSRCPGSSLSGRTPTPPPSRGKWPICSTRGRGVGADPRASTAADKEVVGLVGHELRPFFAGHDPGTAIIDEACCAGLPHAADAVMGLLAPRPLLPRRRAHRRHRPRPTSPRLASAVRRIYGEGIATGIATFETTVPNRTSLDATWLPEHRWVAEIDGEVVGWTAASPYPPATVTQVSPKPLLRGRRPSWPKCRQCLAVQASHRSRHRRTLGPTNIDLHREPGQHRPAPRRRLPHRRHPRTHCPTRRHLARHHPHRTPLTRPIALRANIRITVLTRPVNGCR